MTTPEKPLSPEVSPDISMVRANCASSMPSKALRVNSCTPMSELRVFFGSMSIENVFDKPSPYSDSEKDANAAMESTFYHSNDI
jgi:hypothetical protein